MSQIYEVLSTSKQAFHQKLKREKHHEVALSECETDLVALRVYHPRMSLRRAHKKILPQGVGRDAYEHYFQSRGFGVRKRKNYRKTTDSRGVTRFPNLVKDREVTGVNQVFVSDITYYEMQGRFYYITLIMDRCNREITGCSLSKSQRSEDTTIPALQAMRKSLGKKALRGAIIHSDGGGQYYDKGFREITKELQMQNSMTEGDVYQNAHAERVNGTIKNDYLYPYNPQTYQELQEALKRAVKMYNQDKPHHSLGEMTPMEYRRTLKASPKNDPITVQNRSKIMSNSVNVFQA